MTRVREREDHSSDLVALARNVPSASDTRDEDTEEYEVTVVSARPGNTRTSSDPSPAVLLQSYFNMALDEAPTTPRTRSPLSRPHLRSRSSGANSNTPIMVRAHSMPAVHSLGRPFESSTPSSGSLSPRLSASHSPQRSPARVRSPLIAETQESGSYFPPPPRSPHWFETANGGPIESIQEDTELDLTPRNTAAYSPLLPTPPPIALASRSGSMRRRPVSPLHSAVAIHTSSINDQDSPALTATKFTESFPSSFQLHHYASTSSFSSISSTPSSARSRSPSISSLETIEDAPDAEYEAIEADKLWRLRLSEKSDSGEDSGGEGTRRKGFGFSRGRNSERKRWSVCGGERRADLDLETIWED